MSKAKYGKKVLKTIVRHRTCGTCNWWRRNRPYVKVRPHFCVKNHSGSASSMESSSGAQGVLEMIEQGTPIEYLEGDGDNTLISRLKKNHQVNMKKRFDRNHVVKNFGKTLYAIHYEKKVKLSKLVIIHLEKYMKYAFAKNQGNLDAMRENLKAIIPHQFGGHSLCHVRYCGHKRKPGVKYVHKSFPYHVPLKDEALRERLQKVFEPYIANAEQYIDLGSSQQCEHANKEVSLRAPKSHHYGHSKSLDYRVHATAAFINEGRHYITEASSESEAAYDCRKGFHAINIQAVVDSNMRFLDIVARWPGSQHDSFIFNNCGLKDILESGDFGYLLGDSGYLLRSYLITPILNPHQDLKQFLMTITAPVGSWLFSSSDSGYMDSELSYEWFMKAFLPNCERARTVVLLMDNHDSYLPLPVVEKDREEYVILVGLPSHTTHYLQLLDVHLIGSLKYEASSLAAGAGFARPVCTIGKSRLPVLLSHVIDQTPASAVKEAFRLAGIMPVNLQITDVSQLVSPTFDTDSHSEDTTDEPTRTCETCGRFIGQNTLVKRGVIPASLAQVLVPPPVRPLSEKRTMSKVVGSGRVILGDEMLQVLKEREAEKMEIKQIKLTDRERKDKLGILAKQKYTCGVCGMRGRVNDDMV